MPEPDGSGAIRTLLFPKSSAKIKAIWRVVGLRGTGSDAYSVANLFVPEEYTVLRGPQVPAREPSLLYRFTRGNLYAADGRAISSGRSARFSSLKEHCKASKNARTQGFILRRWSWLTS